MKSQQQGRGSALVVGLMLIIATFRCELADAASFTVGDAGGWTFNVAGWTKGKRFRSGDTLVFSYSPSLHNVVAVNKAGYDGCSRPRGSKVFMSGKDQIKLGKGMNYYICSFPGHCQSGMKIAVNAL